MRLSCDGHLTMMVAIALGGWLARILRTGGLLRSAPFFPLQWCRGYHASAPEALRSQEDGKGGFGTESCSYSLCVDALLSFSDVVPSPFLFSSTSCPSRVPHDSDILRSLYVLVCRSKPMRRQSQMKNRQGASLGLITAQGVTRIMRPSRRGLWHSL